ncbi:carboxy-cis-cis-muconate cyclase [Apiospora marii]|uniref:carboxy-cis-cis-muconate cyclase n=1 Tax=Apiospora marii TaxID=335849 RepID=UPI00312F02C8
MILMRLCLSPFVLWASAILAATHHMLVGTFSTNSIYTFTFDDETNQLTEVANTSTPVGSSWLTLSKDKRTLYGTAWDVQPAAFVSYAVDEGDNQGPTVRHQATVLAGGNCTGSAISVLAAVDPPWTVYGNLYYRDARCATVFSVDAANAGALDGGIVQSYTYDLPGSAVHGMTWSAVVPNVVYSADTGGNAVWTHARDGTTGALTPVDKLVLPADRGHCGPRHLAAHRLGLYLYVVCEASSKIIQLRLNEDEFATPNATAADKEWPILRDGEDAADFWADEVLMSATGDFMWASNRAHDTGRQGYVSVFALQSEDGDVAAQMFLQTTATSGGFANAIAPSPFDDRVAALTENVTGSVEIWRAADDYRSASVVAHLDLPDGGGCCANVLWYS